MTTRDGNDDDDADEDDDGDDDDDDDHSCPQDTLSQIRQIDYLMSKSR